MAPDGTHRAPRLRVSIVDDDGRPVGAPALAAWLGRVAPSRARGAVTIALVSDKRIRALNRQYRGIDAATDVLSFPAAAPATYVAQSQTTVAQGLSPAKQPAFLGDIVIARGVAARQARAAGHAERTEWRVLALHGLLHLMGYDHERDDGEMRRLERRLRRKGGLRESLTERGGRA
jgi:probable rRNA maturation factor